MLYNQIPTLSPSEEQWLKTEYDDTIADERWSLHEACWGCYEGKREHGAFESQSPTHSKLTLNLPCSATDRSILHTKRGIGLSLAALLMDHEFWQDVDDLQQRGVIDKQQLKFLGEFPRPNGHSVGSTDIERSCVAVSRQQVIVQQRLEAVVATRIIAGSRFLCNRLPGAQEQSRSSSLAPR